MSIHTLASLSRRIDALAARKRRVKRVWLEPDEAAPDDSINTLYLCWGTPQEHPPITPNEERSSLIGSQAGLDGASVGDASGSDKPEGGGYRRSRWPDGSINT